jgi:sortase A
VRDFRLILEWVGRTFLVAGILILGFVAYQLWGTGLLESRAQGNLRDQFDARAQTVDTPATTAPAGTPTTTAAPVPVPDEGAIAVMRIPAIDLERTVVNGVSAGDLRQGPGRYPQTVLPGERGNSALAGHRTTYGAPFNRLDELKLGDEIIMRTLNGTFTYRVSADPFIVSPREVSVLEPSSDTMLTLTTCHPKFSAAERLIVQAKLDTTVSPAPLPPSAPVDPNPPTDSDLAGGSVPVFALLLSGLFLVAVGAGWWWAFRRRPHWTTWALGCVVFLVPLFLFYYFVEQSLPNQF